LADEEFTVEDGVDGLLDAFLDDGAEEFGVDGIDAARTLCILKAY
jgi:hypothetical protein